MDIVYVIGIIAGVIVAVDLYLYLRKKQLLRQRKYLVDDWFIGWTIGAITCAVDNELISTRNIWPVSGMDGYYFLPKRYYTETDGKITLHTAKYSVYYNPLSKDFYTAKEDGENTIDLDSRPSDFDDDFHKEIQLMFDSNDAYKTDYDLKYHRTLIAKQDFIKDKYYQQENIKQ